MESNRKHWPNNVVWHGPKFIACFHVSIIHILIHISLNCWMFRIALSKHWVRLHETYYSCPIPCVEKMCNFQNNWSFVYWIVCLLQCVFHSTFQISSLRSIIKDFDRTAVSWVEVISFTHGKPSLMLFLFFFCLEIVNRIHIILSLLLLFCAFSLARCVLHDKSETFKRR